MTLELHVIRMASSPVLDLLKCLLVLQVRLSEGLAN